MHSNQEILCFLSRSHNSPTERVAAAKGYQACYLLNLAEVFDEQLEGAMLPSGGYALDLNGALFLLFPSVCGGDGGDAAVGVERFFGDPGVVTAYLVAQDVVEEFYVRSGRESNVVCHGGSGCVVLQVDRLKAAVVVLWYLSLQSALACRDKSGGC